MAAPCAYANATIIEGFAAPSDNNSWCTGVSANGSVVVGVSGMQPYEQPPGPTYDVFRWTAGTGMVGLGHLPGDSFSTDGIVSGDGSVVVGLSQHSYNSAVGQAFRWTAGSGMVGLGYLPGGTNSQAFAVSSNGSVIIGTSSSAAGTRAFRWTVGSGMVALGVLPGDTNSEAAAISADGSVIVGASYTASGAHAFRWTAASGMVGLGHLPGDTYSSATGVSGDGSVVIGSSDSGYFRWATGSGMVTLGVLPGDTSSSAAAISADGSVIVGTSYSASGSQAFRWTVGSGMVGLGHLPYDTHSAATGVSGDGSVAIGSSDNGYFRWATGSGMQSLSDVLLANGANPDGLDATLDTASGLSIDGNTIVGYGEQNGDGRPEAWIVIIPGLYGVSPPLSIKSSSSTAKQLVLCWPTNYAGFTLQASTSLVSTNWTNCAGPGISGADFVVSNGMSAGAQFFRLKK
jgi:probable HAF family extracellular repeat protein